MKGRKVRIRTTAELGKAWPPVARVLFEWYLRMVQEHNLPNISFSVNSLPKSLNHQYIKRGASHFALHPEQRTFRELTGYAIGPKKFDWNPTGVTAALIFFESPHWLKKDLTVREADADNLVKPVFDAIQEVTGVNDSLNWQVHFFKVPSKKTRTIVYLFDLGDVVDHFG